MGTQRSEEFIRIEGGRNTGGMEKTV